MNDSATLQQTATFANTLKNRIDILRLNRTLLSDRARTILSHYFSDGQIQQGEFKLSEWGGGYGSSLCFNLSTGVFKDFGDSAPGGVGLVSYLARHWKQSLQTVVDKLIADKFVSPKEVYGTSRKVQKSDVGSLVLPAPEDEDVEVAIKPSKQAFVKGKWAYRDVDNALLGYVVRFEEPGGKKQTPPYTYWTDGGWVKTGWAEKWPLYGLEQLQQRGKGARIILVEGEKTAEKAKALLPGCVVLGYGGVNKVDKLELSFLADALVEREIVIWPDNDGVGISAGKKLAWRLTKELKCKKVKRVEVERIDELKGKEGWDLGDWTEESNISVMATLEGAADQCDIDSYIMSWIYVNKLSQFFHVNPVGDDEGLDVMEFRRAYQHIHPKLDNVLLEDSRLIKVDTVTFWPGKPRLITDGSGLKLNLWTPDGLSSELETTNFAEQGLVYTTEMALRKTEAFRTHLEFIFPDERVRSIFLSYLKYLIEEPGEKANWCPLIQGMQGTGKSYFGILMSDIMGSRNVTQIGNDQITGEHTGWMMNTALAVVEEVNMGGRREFTDRMKPLITNDRVMINEKYMRARSLDNRVNFLMFTNHMDALILEDSDRRFLIYYSPADVNTCDPNYFKRLFREKRENLWWIYHYLINEVEILDELDFKGRAPDTESKQEMIRNSLRDVDAEIVDMVELGNTPFHKDVVSVVEIVDALRDKGHSKVTTHSIGRSLSRLRFSHLGQQKWGRGNTERVRLWAVRNIDKWGAAPLDEVREEFNKTIELEAPNVVGFKKRESVF